MRSGGEVATSLTERGEGTLMPCQCLPKRIQALHCPRGRFSQVEYVRANSNAHSVGIGTRSTAAEALRISYYYPFQPRSFLPVTDRTYHQHGVLLPSCPLARVYCALDPDDLMEN